MNVCYLRIRPSVRLSRDLRMNGERTQLSQSHGQTHGKSGDPSLPAQDDCTRLSGRISVIDRRDRANTTRSSTVIPNLPGKDEGPSPAHHPTTMILRLDSQDVKSTLRSGRNNHSVILSPKRRIYRVVVNERVLSANKTVRSALARPQNERGENAVIAKSWPDARKVRRSFASGSG